jgi:hypothetical protein
MDTALLGKLFEVTGPWGLIALLIFLQWRREEREADSAHKAIEALSKGIADLTADFVEHNRRVEKLCQDVAILAAESKSGGRRG